MEGFAFLLALPLEIIIQEVFWYFEKPEELATICRLLSAGLYKPIRLQLKWGDEILVS
jgi:hypothetical protein